MPKIEVESFSETSNSAVIRLPGRNFPAIAIQGDSLKILSDCAGDLARLSRGSDLPELQSAVSELTDILNGYQRAYEDALRAHGEPLPY